MEWGNKHLLDNRKFRTIWLLALTSPLHNFNTENTESLYPHLLNPNQY